MKKKNVNRILRLCVVLGVAYLVLMFLGSVISLVLSNIFSSVWNIVIASPIFIALLFVFGGPILAGIGKLIEGAITFVFGKEDEKKKQVSKNV